MLDFVVNYYWVFLHFSSLFLFGFNARDPQISIPDTKVRNNQRQWRSGADFKFFTFLLVGEI